MGLSSTPKSCAQRCLRYQWGVEPGCGFQFNPEKWGSEMKAINGGWTSCLSSTPKSCAQTWKVPVGGSTRMWVPVQPRKVRFKDESHQWGVEPRVWVQPRKVVLRHERYQYGVEPGCGFQFNPEKWGSEMKAINGGWTSCLSSTPKSCAQRWKVSVGGWTRMWVPVQPRKVRFRDGSHQQGPTNRACRLIF